VPDRAPAATVKLALAGDTMLGRGVATALESCAPETLVASEVVAVAREADLFLLNLECCISERGEPWPDPGKPFFFRAPPRATELLAHLGVDCVTLANNHALDFGQAALLDTLGHLAAAGIACVGAGADIAEARAPAVLEAGGFRLGVVAATDHPEAYAAGPDRPGVAFADLRRGSVPGWLRESVFASAADADAVLATVHWGPNMVAAPAPHVRAAAETLLDAGAALVAGHSAHVFHGAGERVLYDLGDFLDDYAVDRRLRNDLGLLFLVTFDAARPVRLEALPLALDYCHTRLAEGEDAAWVRERFQAACAALGTEMAERGGRLVVEWP
jgi:poly-gamma-glutamate capsule biosynthesis protein CapA/YwtB (metallophosphatase superfamily)